MVTNEMKLLTSFGDIKNLLSKMIFCNKTNVNARKICYNHISITGSDFLERRNQSWITIWNPSKSRASNFRKTFYSLPKCSLNCHRKLKMQC